MGNNEIVSTFLDAFQAADADTLASCCADGFSFSGPVPEPIGAQELAGMIVLMKQAFPDIQYNSKVKSEEGDVVHVTSQLTGTHTGDMDLSSMGMGVIPATGKSFAGRSPWQQPRSRPCPCPTRTSAWPRSMRRSGPRWRSCRPGAARCSS